MVHLCQVDVANEKSVMPFAKLLSPTWMYQCK